MGERVAAPPSATPVSQPLSAGVGRRSLPTGSLGAWELGTVMLHNQ